MECVCTGLGTGFKPGMKTEELSSRYALEVVVMVVFVMLVAMVVLVVLVVLVMLVLVALAVMLGFRVSGVGFSLGCRV